MPACRLDGRAKLHATQGGCTTPQLLPIRVQSLPEMLCVRLCAPMMQEILKPTLVKDLDSEFERGEGAKFVMAIVFLSIER